tara:strand:+ start:1558 stop:1668 length:111 start_codon:yes stop_codon:yes gene_type:complete
MQLGSLNEDEKEKSERNEVLEDYQKLRAKERKNGKE